MKKITIIVDGQGQTKVEASGFSGRECLDATRAIEEAIGKTFKREDKPEMKGTARKALVTQ